MTWQKVINKEDAYLDFTKVLEPDSFGVAYALVYVESPRKYSTQLGVGSNDGVRVWLNDKSVHNNPILRPASPNEDIIPVTLKKGWNKILIKVDQAGLSWGLYLSLPDPDKILRFSTQID